MSGCDSKKTIVKRKRCVMTLDKKIQLLDCLATGESYASTAKKFKVNESTVRTIKKCEDSIRSSILRGTSSSCKVTCISRPQALETMEKALYFWIEDQTKKRVPLSTQIIQEKAILLYNSLKSDNESLNFQASKGWFERFKKRFSLHNVKIVGESASANHAAAGQYPIMNANNESSDEEDTFQELAGKSTLSLTLDKINKILSSAHQLQDLVLDLDPSLERSVKFNNSLECLLQPYKEAQKDIKKITKQSTIHSFFKK